MCKPREWGCVKQLDGSLLLCEEHSEGIRYRTVSPKSLRQLSGLCVSSFQLVCPMRGVISARSVWKLRSLCLRAPYLRRAAAYLGGVACLCAGNTLRDSICLRQAAVLRLVLPYPRPHPHPELGGEQTESPGCSRLLGPPGGKTLWPVHSSSLHTRKVPLSGPVCPSVPVSLCPCVPVSRADSEDALCRLSWTLGHEQRQWWR